MLSTRYIGYGGFFLGVYLIYHAKPLEALDIKYWAAPRAAKELEVEMRMLDKLAERPELKERLVAVCKDLNMLEEEAYDLVFMRKGAPWVECAVTLLCHAYAPGVSTLAPWLCALKGEGPGKRRLLLLLVGRATSMRQYTLFLPFALHPRTATEYKVLMGLHTGRVPEDLKAIYEELEGTE